MDARMVMTTVSSAQEAKELAEALLGRKKAACIQCQNITRYHRWNGEVKNDPEVLLLIKCREEHVADVRESYCRTIAMSCLRSSSCGSREDMTSTCNGSMTRPSSHSRRSGTHSY
jgi:uncharacterized protein involved in tolerance to divalent cations